jgi:hypothetical protein
MSETTSAITLKKRQPCPYCFITINPARATTEYKNLVQCSKCRAIYHLSCQAKIEECINRPNGEAYICGGNEFLPIQAIATIPTLKAVTRDADVFKGLENLKAAKGNSTSVASDRNGAANKVVPPSTTATPAPLTPRPESAGAGTDVRKALLPSKAVVSPGRRFIPQTIFTAIGVVIGWPALFLLQTTYRPSLNNIVAAIQGNLSSPYTRLLFVFETLAISLTYYFLQRGRRQGGFSPTILMPSIIGILLWYLAITLPNVIVYNSSQWLDNYSLIQAVAFTLALVIPAAAFNNIILRMIFTVVTVGAAVDGSLTVISYNNNFSSLVRDLPNFPLETLILGIAIGAIPWLPELGWGAIRADSSGAKDDAPNIETSIPRFIRRRAILYRTIGLSIPLAVAWWSFSRYVFMNSCFDSFSCRSNANVAQLFYTILPMLVASFVINLYIVEPILTKPNKNFWSKLFSLIFWGTAGGLLAVGTAYLIQQAYSISIYSFGYGSFYTNSIVTTLWTISVSAALTMTVSTSTGHTRGAHVFKSILWLILISGLIAGGLIMLSRPPSGSPVNSIISAAFGGGIGSIVITIPTWFADWLAQRNSI